MCGYEADGGQGWNANFLLLGGGSGLPAVHSVSLGASGTDRTGSRPSSPAARTARRRVVPPAEVRIVRRSAFIDPRDPDNCPANPFAVVSS
jgi:hypothetical protein